jgi:Vitamin K-dependent gamma-carboxylase
MSSVVLTAEHDRVLASHKWLHELFAIDLRALSTLRIGTALILLWETVLRWQCAEMFFSDSGILSRTSRMQLLWDYSEPWWISLYMLHGSVTWAYGLLLLSFMTALALLVGYRTKLALATSLVLLLSVHARFPMLLQGGDVLFRCLLFWMLFLPLNSHWSVANTPSKSQSTLSVASAALLIQLLCMYFFSAALKTSPEWTENFSATYYALGIGHFTTRWGYALMEYPQLLQILTAVTIALEWCGPWLLLIPYYQQKLWRWLIPFLFMSFHIGLICSMHLGTFPWVCLLYWLAFLPSPVWNAAEHFVAKWKCKSQKKTCELHATTFELSNFGNIIATFFLGYVLLLNVNRLRSPVATVGQAPLSLVGKVTGLEQYWNMFAPGPYQYGSWLRLEGITMSGKLVNLYASEEPLTPISPENVSETYASQYVRRCFVTAFEFEEVEQRQGILRFYVGKWNDKHSVNEKIISARLVHMTYPTLNPFTQESSQVSQRNVLCEVLFAARSD